MGPQLVSPAHSSAAASSGQVGHPTGHTSAGIQMSAAQQSGSSSIQVKTLSKPTIQIKQEGGTETCQLLCSYHLSYVEYQCLFYCFLLYDNSDYDNNNNNGNDNNNVCFLVFTDCYFYFYHQCFFYCFLL